MTRYHPLVPLLLIVTVGACRSNGAPAPHAASLDQRVVLAPREQAVYSQQGLTVEFVRVVDDSRCPSDVTCIWAGEVKVQLSTRIDPAQAVQHEIIAGQHSDIGALRLIVVDVQPTRISTHKISPEEYRVTLRVEQAPG